MFTWYIYGVSPKETILINRSDKIYNTLKECAKELRDKMRVHHYPNNCEAKALIYSTDSGFYFQMTNSNPFTNSMTECDCCHRTS